MENKDKEIKATVLIADGTVNSQGETFKIKNLKVPAEVPVSFNFDENKLIGWANLRIEGENILADVKIDKDSQVNLSEKELDMLYPAIDAVYETRNKIGICSVGFSKSPNADERIKTIGEQKIERYGKTG